VSKPPPVRKTVTYRKLKSIDVKEFKTDILTSDILKVFKKAPMLMN
jgi:hypothetical protein